MTDDDLDALREQTDTGDRLDEANTTDGALRDSIAEYLAEIDDGDRQKTVSVWDGDLAALVAALEDNPNEMQVVGEALRKKFDDEAAGEVDRSEVLRRALRLGLREAAPDHVDTLREAVRDHAVEDL